MPRGALLIKSIVSILTESHSCFVRRSTAFSWLVSFSLLGCHVRALTHSAGCRSRWQCLGRSSSIACARYWLDFVKSHAVKKILRTLHCHLCYEPASYERCSYTGYDAMWIFLLCSTKFAYLNKTCARMLALFVPLLKAPKKVKPGASLCIERGLGQRKKISFSAFVCRYSAHTSR